VARPTRQGVDYFPLDVHLDNKFKFVEIKFGLEGFAVVIKILQEIYAQGYFCEWGEDEKLLFSNEHNINFDRLNEISRECLERDIFDLDLHEKHKILTSRGIQSRYKEIVRRRKDVDITREYILIDGNFGVNDDTVTTSSRHADVKSTQSKVKESKVNNKNRRKKTYDESSLYYKMADYFYKLILNNNPGHKKPNYQRWSDDFRKIVELDERNKDQVRKVMEFVQKDDFEMSNVLSPNKLRKRYDQLLIKSNQVSGNIGNRSPSQKVMESEDLMF
jgi:hypothetical protein